MSPGHHQIVLLTLILAFNYVDRFALGILLQDIKVDLTLSDTQLGVFTGLAFAVFYSVMGLPIARWADIGNRVTILSLTTALWSVAVALCGTATSFLQLLLIRVGVAVGEAGCYSPALSLISDQYHRSDRPRAVSRFMLGIPLAMVIGYFLGGWFNQLYGWRVTFLAIGAPGIVLALVAWATLHEPRAQIRGRTTFVCPPVRLTVVLRNLWTSRAYRHLLFCFSIWGFFGYGIQQWQPAFFMRSFGVASGELGSWLVGVVGICGLLGTWAGGEACGRFAPDDEELQLKAMALLYAISTATGSAVYLAPTVEVAYGSLALTSFIGAMANGPLFAASQTLVPPEMRATSIAVMYFFCNLIGLGLGPLGVGALSDALSARAGNDSLRYALLTFSPGYVWCAWHLWQAGRAVRAESPPHLSRSLDVNGRA